MSFRLEAQLREPVTAWLLAEGFEVCGEVAFLRRRADLVGVRADLVTAVEMKLYDWRTALRQAIAYQVAVDRSWVALPLGTAADAYRDRWDFSSEGVGLLAVDTLGLVRVVLPAQASPRLLGYARTALAASARRVLEPRPFSNEETDLEAF